MNIESGDALLTSIWPGAVSGTAINGEVVDVKAPDLILDGQLKVRLKVLEDLAAGAASTVTITVGTGVDESCSDVIVVSPGATHDQMVAGWEWTYTLPKGVQNQYLQIRVAATEALTGGSMQADFQPIKS